MTFDTTRLYGLEYDDYEEEIYINCDRNIESFEKIVPLRDFLQEKGLDSLIKDTYTEEELTLLYNGLAVSRPKSLKMLPTDNKR